MSPKYKYWFVADEFTNEIRSKIKDEYVDIFLKYFENCKQVANAYRGLTVERAPVKIYMEKEKYLYSSDDAKSKDRQIYRNKFYK